MRAAGQKESNVTAMSCACLSKMAATATCTRFECTCESSSRVAATESKQSFRKKATRGQINLEPKSAPWNTQGVASKHAVGEISPWEQVAKSAFGCHTHAIAYSTTERSPVYVLVRFWRQTLGSAIILVFHRLSLGTSQRRLRTLNCNVCCCGRPLLAMKMWWRSPSKPCLQRFANLRSPRP